MEEAVIKEKIAPLENYIMKHCLWQFHSRKWDRERQNERILGRTSDLLCGGSVPHETPEDKCYWVDAVCLAEAFQRESPWLVTADKSEIKEVMQALKDRIDYLTITGSLNLELTDQHY